MCCRRATAGSWKIPIYGPRGDAGPGSFLVLFLRVEDGRIAAAKYQTVGCGPTIACGSMLSELVVGRTIEACGELPRNILIEALDGVPPDKLHCPAMAIAACEMHSAIGNRGKIFNHERDEIHEKGKTEIRRQPTIRQGPDQDSLGSAWHASKSSCLQVEERQTLFSIDDFFRSFVFFVVKRMSRPRSKKSIRRSAERSVVPIPDAVPARAEKGSAGPAVALSRSLPACGGGNVRGRPPGLYRSQTVHRQINARLRALIHNDLAVLAAIEGKFDEARTGWRKALEVDPECLWLVSIAIWLRRS